jgi:putative OPT family oligopeptide transporter
LSSITPQATTAPPPDTESLAEFTARAVAAGVVFGLVFGAANAYLGLRVGLTVSTSIPIAVLTVALFRALRIRVSILEANISQTVGSASSSLAAGTIFTIPALFLWGLTPPLWQVAGLAFLGGILGISAMVPLRRLLIVRSAGELPYPEGQACAEVLRATTAGAAGGHWIFIGLAVGAMVKLALGAFVLASSEIGFDVPVLPKAHLALEIAPALLAVGYILGYKSASVMVSGSLISALVLIPLIALLGEGLTTPLFPETTTTISSMTGTQIWSRYVRYIGAGAVAAAGIVTVLRSIPTMYSSFRAVIAGLRTDETGAAIGVERTDRDVPGWVVLVGPALVVLSVIFIPGLIGGDMGFGPRVVAGFGVAIFGVMFVVVSSRIVGLIGVSSNPTSGMALVTLLGTALIFVALGWAADGGARAAILTVGTVVCIAASKAGDISQDLKTGQLVGATPEKQQMGQFISAAFACWAVAGTVLMLGSAYTFGSSDLPAPQATLMRTVIDGVLAGALPWGLVGTGIAFSLCAMLAGLPGLSFAVGVYLPVASLTPIFMGGLVRRIVEARRGAGAAEGDPGVLAASGMIAGEGLAGVLLAFLVAGKKTFPDRGWAQALESMHIGARDFRWLTGAPAAALGVAIVLGVGFLLYRSAMSATPAPKHEA